MTDLTMDLPAILAAHTLWLRGEGGEWANLSGANLSGANLSGANLSEADLSGTDLSGANLSRANLSGANLSGTDLSRANMSGTDLSRANMSGANLSGTDLSGANLSRANLIDGGQRSDGYRFIGHIREGTLWILAGCRYFSIAEGREHWERTRSDTNLGAETTCILDHIEAVAKIRKLIVPRPTPNAFDENRNVEIPFEETET